RASINGSDFAIPSFPSYQTWSGFDERKDVGTIPDKFPLRSELGTYLSERYDAIAKDLVMLGKLEVVLAKVTSLDYSDGEFKITTDGKETYSADEVVLTIGHQPTKVDKQLVAWKEKLEADTALQLFTAPYPVDNISKDVKKGDVIALRGFGLAMIDVARALTEGLGGSFELLDKNTRKMSYRPSEENEVQLVPFSLDGLPMTPKPLHLDLDEPYMPSKEELEVFAERLRNSVRKGGKVSDTRFLIDAITPLIVKKYLSLGDDAYTHTLTESELEHIATQWLEDGSTEHALIISKSLPAYQSMTAFVEMATGHTKISLDYCLGQVWRHCQPTMYKELSFTDLDDTLIAEIIQLDERLKRYSYGPPVDSLRQLLAMIDEGAMTLDFVNDPDIELNANGWKLRLEDKQVVANSMVDSVLDSPKLLTVNSPIVKSLLSDSLVEPVHSALGISTTENALVELAAEKEIIPLAVLGRLAKGTIIGVDAILECFGERSELWAEGVVERLGITLENN
ncbi:FAD/NAD(P)-binding protein, partial [Maribacter sp.]|nr:FAD/NAD(P)-binding protein [Maribacter sp.]